MNQANDLKLQSCHQTKKIADKFKNVFSNLEKKIYKHIKNGNPCVNNEPIFRPRLWGVGEGWGGEGVQTHMQIPS